MIDKVNIVVIGGGFYGVNIALYLMKRKGFSDILLVEKENCLLSRASYVNQARVHNGYHYPRSFTTAYRSRVNFPRFVQDWRQAIKSDFTKLYAIARRNSKVTAKQFMQFCKSIGAEIERPSVDLSALFNPKLIEDTFLVKEYAFDASILAQWALSELANTPITVKFEQQVTEINKGENGYLNVVIQDKHANKTTIQSRYVFNCTYSGLNQYQGDFVQYGLQTKLKHEITEMALLQMPPELIDLGITVMDGPFFSVMPFPARKLHSLSHVRYTPHFYWQDSNGKNPYTIFEHYEKATRVDRMMRDVSRYIPSLSKANYQDSIFDVKTVLVKNESDDGRPILFEKNTALPGLYSVLGGKIDNIYDIFERLDNEF